MGQAGGDHIAWPFLVPDLRDQLLVTFAQGWLLVCSHQATTLQEELGEWGARLGVESQDGKEMGGTWCYLREKLEVAQQEMCLPLSLMTQVWSLGLNDGRKQPALKVIPDSTHTRTYTLKYINRISFFKEQSEQQKVETAMEDGAT